jgi:hypothetical protein
LYAARDRWASPAVDEAERVAERFRRLTAGGDVNEGEDQENQHDAADGRFANDADGDAAGASAADASAGGKAAGDAGDASDGGIDAAVSARAAEAAPEQSSIKVCVRMRPRGAGTRVTGPAAGADGEHGVVLPLHQRLQIIKAQRGGCSSNEAMRILMEDSGRGAEAG